MLRRFKKVLLLTAFTILCVFLLLSKAMAQPAAPDADATFLDITHEYTLNPDGSTVFSYAHRLQYHSYYAFTRAYGESFVVTNPASQTLKITRTQTKMADGTEVKAPFNAFNEVLPGFAAGIAPYIHLREMVITHTGLERGAVADFAYTVATKPGFLPGLSGKVIFGDRSPIQSFTVRVKVPVGTKLNWDLRPFSGFGGTMAEAAKPTQATEGKWTVWEWHLAGLPLYPVESQQRPIDLAVPVLYFSTASYADLQKHVGADDAALYALDRPAAVTIGAGTKGESNQAGIAMNFRKLLEAQVAGMSCDFALIGCKPMPAQRTWDKAAGSVLDKAVLLAAACKANGIKAVPVLLSPVNTVAAPQAFSSAAVLCEGIGARGRMLLDPNANQVIDIPARYSGWYYLPLDGSSTECTQLDMNADANAMSFTADLTVSPDGAISGKARLETGGVFGSLYETKRVMTALTRAIGAAGQGCTAKDDGGGTSGKDRCFAEVTVASKQPLGADAGLVRFVLPALPGGVDDMHVNLGLETRVTPVDFVAPFEQQATFTLRLPAGWKLASLPEDLKNVAASNEVGEVSSVVTSSAGLLGLKRTFRLKQHVIAPAQYAQLRALLAAWKTQEHSALSFSIPAK